jgi:hypothetical protein
MSNYDYLSGKKRALFSAPWTVGYVAGYAQGFLSKQFGNAAEDKAEYKKQMDSNKSLQNAGGTVVVGGTALLFNGLIDTIFPVAAIGTTVADGMGKATGERFGAFKAGRNRGLGR